jgi:hypothetical protein
MCSIIASDQDKHQVSEQVFHQVFTRFSNPGHRMASDAEFRLVRR